MWDNEPAGRFTHNNNNNNNNNNNIDICIAPYGRNFRGAGCRWLKPKFYFLLNLNMILSIILQATSTWHHAEWWQLQIWHSYIPSLNVEHREKLRNTFFFIVALTRTIKLWWLINFNSFALPTATSISISLSLLLDHMRNTSSNSRLQLSKKFYFSILLTANVHYTVKKTTLTLHTITSMHINWFW